MTGVEDMTIGEVISMADKMNICRIDDKLKRYISNNQYVYKYVSMVRYSEYRHLYDYLQQQQPFSTQHKTKGLEYNVSLIIQIGISMTLNHFLMYIQIKRIL